MAPSWVAGRSTMSLIFLCLASLIAHGCEQMFGVRRSASISHLPAEKCILSTLESEPLVEDYTVWSRLSDAARKSGDPADMALTYSGLDLEINVLIEQDSSGRVALHQTHLYVDREVSSEDVRAVRRLMRAIERALAARCHLPGLLDPHAVREKCYHVDCRAPIPEP